MENFDKSQSLTWVKCELVREQSYEIAAFVRDWENDYHKYTYRDLTIKEIKFIPEILGILELKFPNQKSISEVRKMFNKEFKQKLREDTLNEIFK